MEGSKMKKLWLTFIIILILLPSYYSSAQTTPSNQCSFENLQMLWNQYVEGEHPLLKNLQCEGIDFWVPIHPGFAYSEFCSGNYYIPIISNTNGFSDDSYREKLWREFLITLAATYYKPFEEGDILTQILHFILSNLSHLILSDLSPFISGKLHEKEIRDVDRIVHVERSHLYIRIDLIKSIGGRLLHFMTEYERVYYKLTVEERIKINWIILFAKVLSELHFEQDELKFEKKAGESFLLLTLYDAYLITLAKELLQHYTFTDPMLGSILHDLSMRHPIFTKKLLLEIRNKQLTETIISLPAIVNIISYVLEAIGIESEYLTLLSRVTLAIGLLVYSIHKLVEIKDYPLAFEHAIVAYTYANAILTPRKNVSKKSQNFILQSGLLALIVGDNMMKFYFNFHLFNFIKRLKTALVDDYWDYWDRFLFNTSRMNTMREMLSSCSSLPPSAWKPIFYVFEVDKSILMFLTNSPIDCREIPQFLSPPLKQLICSVGRQYREGQIDDNSAIIKKLKKLARCYMQNGNMEDFYFINDAIMGNCNR